LHTRSTCNNTHQMRCETSGSYALSDWSWLKETTPEISFLIS
jgi:hypothetical protein